jgi:catechol 2,3-dioxygenase-like lactoylglutathione lyase family enzyme
MTTVETTVERAIPILPGEDISVAKAFYVDTLGFELEYYVTDDGKNGIMGVRRGTIELTIDCPMSGHGRNACASLRVNSTDAYYGEWRAKVESKRAPVNEEWGSRTWGFQDPFGNSIFLIGPVDE